MQMNTHTLKCAGGSRALGWKHRFSTDCKSEDHSGENELEKTYGWALEHGGTPFLSTPECTTEPIHTLIYTYTHTGLYRCCFWAWLHCKNEIRDWRERMAEKKAEEGRDGENTD